jgi:hypothetical protein
MRIKAQDIADLSKEEIDKMISNGVINRDGLIRWARNVHRRASRVVSHIFEVKEGPNYQNLAPRVKHALRLRDEAAKKEADEALAVLATMRVDLNERIRPISNVELEMLLEETRKPKE